MNAAVTTAVIANVACPVCGEATQVVFKDLYDDRYGYPDAFTLYECGACGHMHVPTNFTPDDLAKLYTQYYPRGNFDLDNFQPEQEKQGLMSWFEGDRGSAFRWVPRNVRVLDIGCGIGATLAYHHNRGCEAIGMEADGNVQPIAQRYGLDIRQGIFDGSQFESGYFDYVTLDQVAEHVTDPHALMRGVARVLKPSGRVIITTPNAGSLPARIFGRKWLNWHTPYHIQFYSRRSLRMVAERAGLKLESARTTTASAWQYYQWKHVVQFPERGQRSAFWLAGQVEPKDDQRRERLIAGARKYWLHAWISRVLDVVGAGDNHVFILKKP
jgi:2-polyprenyl-3-methyl-5-hydroxy-6-metoxy-1,4-benzoquinol methylase